jgi:hypothetical protein
MSRLQALRSELANRRTVRQDRRELERQLAAYDTPSARLDIEAVLDRYDTGDTEQIRSILHRQATDRLMRTGH